MTRGLALPELLRRAASGDQAAWSELDTRYRCFVRAVIAARMRADLRATTEVEDLVQAVFLEFARHAGRLAGRDDAALRSWLSRVAIHRLIDAGRRASGEPAAQFTSADEADVQDGRAPLAELAGEDELLERLHDRIAALPQPDRDLVVARYVLDESWVEIARRTGLSETTARRRAEQLIQTVLRAVIR